MPNQKKLRRKPTRTAVVVGAASFLVSLCIGIGCFVLILDWLHGASPTAATVVLYVGSLPWLLLIVWLAAALMGGYERLTGTSLRTKSARMQEE